jgi:hypothetical protein
MTFTCLLRATATTEATTGHGHKRTISDVVPRVKRETEREVEREEAVQEVNEVNSDDEYYRDGEGECT